MKNEIVNQQMWLQGLYNYNAFAVVIANAFRGKSGKTEKYAEMPYDIFGANKKTDEEKAIEEREKLILALNAYKTMFNKAKGGNNASC